MSFNVQVDAYDMSNTSRANAPTIIPVPINPPNVNGTVPKSMSEKKVRTIVSRLPTDVTIGPQIPRRIIVPALKTTADAAIPAIAIKVSTRVGKRNSSSP